MKFINLVKRFASEKTASILPTFAVLVTPLMIAGGVAVDYALMAKNRAKMINAADAAILAAAVEAKKLPDLKDEVAVKAKLKSEIDSFLQANLEDMKNVNFEVNDVKYDKASQAVNLKVDLSFETSFMKLAGVSEIESQVETAVYIEQDEHNTLSMYLVLDRSGSMGWRDRQPRWRWNGRRWVFDRGTGEIRMTSLKKAVNSLYQQFEEQDPEHNYVRTGGSAYQSRIQGRAKMDWGAKHLDRFTQSLRANGGTNSSRAMSDAAFYLKGDKEHKEHLDKNKGNPQRYILFMTDGENNRTSYDISTLRHCTNAKNDNITVYTVAFHAPTRGQNLLKACATSEDHYYKAENSSELVAIFKEIGVQTAKKLAIAQ